MIPKVTITQLQGQLRVQAPSTSTVAVIGVSSTGTVDVPQAFTRSRSLRNEFGEGPLCELASQCIDLHGLTVVGCKIDPAADGSYGTIDDDGITGTVTPTAAVSPLPFDAYEVRIDVVTGGTVGVAGIEYTYSLDGGVTNSGILSLGTASSIELTGYGVKFALGAGTLVAGDFWTVDTVAPTIDATGITSALTELLKSSVAWDCCIIAGDITGALVDTIETAFSAAFLQGKYRWWQAAFRVPTSGESDATYQAAFASSFASKSTIRGLVHAGAVDFTSPVSGRVLVRAPLYEAAGIICALDPQVDPAWINNGPLRSVSLRDDLGNLVHHDEQETPGLDDLRAVSMRSWDGYTGVYINNARVLSAAGSDYKYAQHVRVMNAALYATRNYLIRRLSYPTRVDRVTGFINELDRKEIENGLTSELRRVLMSAPMCSDAYAVVARDNNLLDEEALEVDIRVIPLAYPKEISVTTSYINPAVQAV